MDGLPFDLQKLVRCQVIKTKVVLFLAGLSEALLGNDLDEGHARVVTVLLNL